MQCVCLDKHTDIDTSGKAEDTPVPSLHKGYLQMPFKRRVWEFHHHNKSWYFCNKRLGLMGKMCTVKQ